MPIFNLKVLTNNGGGAYLDLDVDPTVGAVTVTSNGLSNIGADGTPTVGEGATYANNTLTLPITILGFATTANKTTADYAVGATLTLSAGSQSIYAVPATPRLSVDVSTLAGWANLSAGSHDITIVAKADGFKDSAPSAAVQVTKAASTKTLKAGTYKWKDVPNFTNAPTSTLFDFLDSNGSSYFGVGITGTTSGYVNYFTNSTGTDYTTAFNIEDEFWENTAYKTITLATDQQVSADFYDWAITGGNLQPVLIVPMSFNIVSGNTDTLEYYNINSTKPTAKNYEYKIVSNSNGAVLTNKAGTVLSSLNLPFYCTLDGGVWKCVGKLWVLTVSGGFEPRYRVFGTDGTDEFSDAEYNSDGSWQFSFTTSDPFAYDFNISAKVPYND